MRRRAEKATRKRSHSQTQPKHRKTAGEKWRWDQILQKGEALNKRWGYYATDEQIEETTQLAEKAAKIADNSNRFARKLLEQDGDLLVLVLAKTQNRRLMKNALEQPKNKPEARSAINDLLERHIKAQTIFFNPAANEGLRIKASFDMIGGLTFYKKEIPQELLSAKMKFNFLNLNNALEHFPEIKDIDATTWESLKEGWNGTLEDLIQACRELS